MAFTCFIAIPFKEEMVTTTKTITKVLRKYGIKYYLAKEDVTAGQDILCKICQNIFCSDFGVIEATYTNPNVMIEFGMLLGQRKPVFILLDESRMESSRIPADIVGLERIQYKNQEALLKKFENGVRNFAQRLDIEEKQLQSLMELAKISASKNDLASVDALLQAIFEKLNVRTRREYRFVDLLEKIMTEFKQRKNLATSLRYGLAGVRVFLMRGERKKAIGFFDKIMHQLSDFASGARVNAENVVRDYSDLSLVSEDPLGFWECWLDRFRTKEFKDPENVELFYAHLWYGLQHSSNHESWMQEFIDIIGIPILKDPPISWFNLHRLPWQGYTHYSFFLMLWINAVTRNYNENKRALDIAKEAIDEIRKSCDTIALNTLQGLGDDWYEEYLNPAEGLKRPVRKS